MNCVPRLCKKCALYFSFQNSLMFLALLFYYIYVVCMCTGRSFIVVNELPLYYTPEQPWRVAVLLSDCTLRRSSSWTCSAACVPWARISCRGFDTSHTWGAGLHFFPSPSAFSKLLLGQPTDCIRLMYIIIAKQLLVSLHYHRIARTLAGRWRHTPLLQVTVLQYDKEQPVASVNTLSFRLWTNNAFYK